MRVGPTLPRPHLATFGRHPLPHRRRKSGVLTNALMRERGVEIAAA
jgi:hypothetical protein